MNIHFYGTLQPLPFCFFIFPKKTPLNCNCIFSSDLDLGGETLNIKKPLIWSIKRYYLSKNISIKCFKKEIFQNLKQCFTDLQKQKEFSKKFEPISKKGDFFFNGVKVKGFGFSWNHFSLLFRIERKHLKYEKLNSVFRKKDGVISHYSFFLNFSNFFFDKLKLLIKFIDKFVNQERRIFFFSKKYNLYGENKNHKSGRIMNRIEFQALHEKLLAFRPPSQKIKETYLNTLIDKTYADSVTKKKGQYKQVGVSKKKSFNSASFNYIFKKLISLTNGDFFFVRHLQFHAGKTLCVYKTVM
mmetsp:Transcript_16560/g.25720  ORF Transcript_16560/g.25720 Transcript_16560/m.25720 type:complete len:299 (+) Transcript_16560:1286-2182(+)